MIKFCKIFKIQFEYIFFLLNLNGKPSGLICVPEPSQGDLVFRETDRFLLVFVNPAE